MANRKIQIQTSAEVWMNLNSLKIPGETMDSVLRRILKIQNIKTLKPEEEKKFIEGVKNIIKEENKNGNNNG